MALSFFLGGHDLEMIEIARLLDEHGCTYVDHRFAWGAPLSAYAPDVERSLAAGHEPVAVELADDMPGDWPARGHLRVVDHHGAAAGADAPTSLEQVAAMIGANSAIETRWRRLVSANDRGHVAGMAAMDATADEIRRVRSADRRAQGVTEADERTALSAIAEKTVSGRLTIVRVDSASATAVSDFILPELGGPGAERLLVGLRESYAAFGDGRMIAALVGAFPRSWWGGALPDSGFWGARRADAGPAEAVVDTIEGAHL